MSVSPQYWVHWVRARLPLHDLVETDAHDVIAEVAQLLEQHYDDLRASGATEFAAKEATENHINDWDQLGDDLLKNMKSRQKSVETRALERIDNGSVTRSGIHWLSDAARDVLLAVRSVRQEPLTSLVMITTLALGIGATAAIYSLVEAVVLRPLPYPESDRLGVITFTGQGVEDSIAITPSDAMDFAAQSANLSALATYRSYSNTLALPDDSLVFVPIAVVQPPMLELLGITPMVGRPFEAPLEEDPPVSEGLISAELWSRHFGSEADILGRELEVAGNSVIVVGVVPHGTRFHAHPEGERERIDVWLPQPATGQRSDHFNRAALTQLAAGATFEQATIEINSIAERSRKETGTADIRGSYAVEPLRDRLVENVRSTLYLLLGIAGFVLLLVSVNVANLALVRALARSQEWAVRAAIGGSASRIIRLALTESAVLALAGGLLGIGVAAASLRILPLLMPDSLPRVATMGINGSVLAFTVAVSLAAALLSGVAPAWHASRAGMQNALKTNGRSSAGGRGRASHFLIAAQFALALVLVVGSALMLRTVVNLYRVDVGFESEGLLTFEFLPTWRMWNEPALRVQFYRDAAEQLEAMPEVESVSWTNSLPLSGDGNAVNWAYDEDTLGSFGELVSYFRRSMPGYFETVGIPLLAGRDFSHEDVENDRYVAIASERMANLAWPDQDPLGKRITLEFGTADGMAELREVEVIGVAPDSREVSLHGDEPPLTYLPAWSTRPTNRAVVRTRGEPTALVPAVRELIRELGIRRPLDNVRAVSRNIDDATADSRFVLSLAATFAALAMLLAGLGIYGVVSNAVGQRRREIGVRMALGATPGAVRSMVLRQGLGVVVIGLGAGTMLALGLGRFLASRLYGVTPNDPLTFAAVVTLLLASAAMACLLPAVRATRIAPSVALRDD
ncbi:MAG: FtsX-like permease family protein [Acidobacteria bacterium]|nr:FtsX-like permease family protein [Acidobacteriota bacterium]